MANLRVLLVEAKHGLESSLIDDLCIVVNYPTSGGNTVPIEEWENLEVLSNWREMFSNRFLLLHLCLVVIKWLTEAAGILCHPIVEINENGGMLGTSSKYSDPSSLQQNCSVTLFSWILSCLMYLSVPSESAVVITRGGKDGIVWWCRYELHWCFLVITKDVDPINLQRGSSDYHIRHAGSGLDMIQQWARLLLWR